MPREPTVDDRRNMLRRLLHRRRRLRLLAVCVGAAILCGAAASILAPKILVGGVRGDDLSAAKGRGRRDDRERRPVLLGLSDRLDLDAREVRRSALRWRTLAADERKDLFRRYWSLADLDPAERDRLLAEYRMFRSLPEDRQARLRRQARELRDFLADLSPQDQAILAGAPQEERAARILELLEQARGR